MTENEKVAIDLLHKGHSLQFVAEKLNCSIEILIAMLDVIHKRG